MIIVIVFVLVGGCAWHKQPFGASVGWYSTILACTKGMERISSFFVDLCELEIWRMGPGTTWVGPAPRCGHLGGRAFPLQAQAGARRGQMPLQDAEIAFLR